ncbi:hypothetical protein ES332_A01G206200v1 [Gossypium tomentosum]|uniref:Uncharacterized protein n=1 Tax=Gossypium tomentosum TaxID=34277 RepID=A0A5D2RTA4_GOSTO|nr:hypothetical protein ES332_A01G206200v1 [Gossypium tomentosum]
MPKLSIRDQRRSSYVDSSRGDVNGRGRAMNELRVVPGVPTCVVERR